MALNDRAIKKKKLGKWKAIPVEWEGRRRNISIGMFVVIENNDNDFGKEIQFTQVQNRLKFRKIDHSIHSFHSTHSIHSIQDEFSQHP